MYGHGDGGGRGVGADEDARAIVGAARRRGIAIELIRNGSRGLLWLERLVEVEVGGTRMAYGTVQSQDVASLFDADFTSGKPHALSHGVTGEIPYLKKQERLTFARVGITDPRSLEDYKEHGGYRGLAAALTQKPADIVASATASPLPAPRSTAFPPRINLNTP